MSDASLDTSLAFIQKHAHKNERYILNTTGKEGTDRKQGLGNSSVVAIGGHTLALHKNERYNLNTTGKEGADRKQGLGNSSVVAIGGHTLAIRLISWLEDGASMPHLHIFSSSYNGSRKPDTDTPTVTDAPNIGTPKQEWNRYRVLQIILPIFLLLVILFELLHKRYSNVDWSLVVQLPEDLQRSNMSTEFVYDAMGWVYEYLSEPQDRRTRIFLITYLLLACIAAAWFALQWTLWMGRWYDLLQYPQENADMFAPLVANYIILASCQIVLSVYTNYIRSWFMIEWQTWMTRRFQALWLANRTYYCMELERNSDSADNPDQRIQSDTDEFVNSSYALAVGFFSTILSLCIYIPMLYRLTPPDVYGLFYCRAWLIYVAIAWAVVGTIIIHFVGRRLIAVKYADQRYGADFRFGLMQVRTNSESIAMLGGEEMEADRLYGRWAYVRRITWELMILHKELGFVQDVYSQLEQLLGILLLVPAYLRGEVSLGTLRMAEDAFGKVRHDFEYVITSYGTLTGWRASAGRLQDLEKWSQKCKEQNLVSSTGDTVEELAVKGLQVKLPTGEVIVEITDELRLRAGDRILISGPVACGKSTLVKAISSIWPHSKLLEGGYLRLPPKDKTLFAGAKSFIPNDSLRNAVCCPELPGKYEDNDIIAALGQVGLEHLLTKYTGDTGSDERSGDGNGDGEGETEEWKPLDRIADWVTVLSKGEQKKLFMAHILLRRPAWLILDEPVAGLDQNEAVRLYQLIIDRLGPETAIITISNDVQGMWDLHSLHFTVNPDKKTLQRSESRT